MNEFPDVLSVILTGYGGPNKIKVNLIKLKFNFNSIIIINRWKSCHILENLLEPKFWSKSTPVESILQTSTRDWVWSRIGHLHSSSVWSAVVSCRPWAPRSPSEAWKYPRHNPRFTLQLVQIWFFQVGDRVMVHESHLRSEVVLVEASSCFAVPASMSDEEAAAFPINYLTAHFCLFELGNLREGQTVLIPSAGGR